MRKKIVNWLVMFMNVTLIVTTILLVFITILRPEWINAAIEWLEKMIEQLGNWNYLIAFASATIESFPIIWMILPWQTVLLLVWGFFGQEYLIQVMIVACLWAILGNYIGFILGYYTGDEFFKRYWEWFGIWETELDYIKSWIHKYWPVAVILSKFHPMTRAFIPFIAWSMGMKQFSFIVYNIIGSIIWAITIIILGVMFASYYEQIVDNFQYIIIVLLIITALYIYFFKREEFRTYLKKKEQEIQKKVENYENKK